MQSLVLVLVVLIAANLPFMIGLIWFRPFSHSVKGLGWFFLEWLVMYAITIAFLLFMESRLGPVASKDWVFWTVTLAVFAVFAFPGFVYRSLWPRIRRRSHQSSRSST